MRIKSKWAILCTVFLFVLVIFPPSAHAYIDPGTGSYILQIVIAGIAAGAFAIKMFWRRIRALFSGSKTQEDSDQELDE
jgi:hypothetical protein